MDKNDTRNDKNKSAIVKNESRDTIQAAWNLFGLTGKVDDYLLYKEIERKQNNSRHI